MKDAVLLCLGHAVRERAQHAGSVGAFNVATRRVRSKNGRGRVNACTAAVSAKAATVIEERVVDTPALEEGRCFNKDLANEARVIASGIQPILRESFNAHVMILSKRMTANIKRRAEDGNKKGAEGRSGGDLLLP